MDSEETLEITVGDLIVALTEEAMKLASDKQEASKVIAFALTHLVYNPGANSQMWH
ncbi:MAG: hypothetical protein HY695_02665 [Deltaproteobacteria bacterium]|nr:hypothetical protein [Deltaproteobacteria bacterium]